MCLHIQQIEYEGGPGSTPRSSWWGLPVCFRINPSLDLSQYAHSTWKSSESFGKVSAIDQTLDGYLWLATETGLRRFDGVRAIEWEPPAGQHLPTRDVRNLMVSRDGTLSIGTAKGLASWKDGKLTSYPEFDQHDISSILQDREGTVWVAGNLWEAGRTKPGEFCSITSAGVRCFGSDGRFGASVTALYEDTRGNFWLGAENGLWRWKPGPPEHYPTPEFRHHDVLFPKKAFLEDQGGLLITGPDGIRRFVDEKFSPYPLPSGVPPMKYGKLLRDRDGGLWIGTWNIGLLHVHEGRTDVFTPADGLSNDSVESLFEDREGNIWIGGNQGLECFRDYAVPTVSVKQGLSNSFVTSVLATGDGSVWIGTSDGLNRWKDGQITVYRKRAAGAKSRASVHEVAVDGLPDNSVGSLSPDAGGRFWISTRRGLARYDEGRFIPVSFEELTAGLQDRLARDSAGNLWMTSDHGLYRVSGRRKAEYFASKQLGLRGSISTLLAVDPRDAGLWVGSWQGGVVNLKDSQVRASYGSADGLGEGRVNALEFDSGNTLWAATDAGLSRISNGHATTLTSGNGLPCDQAHGVVEDDSRSLWIYMACGLVRIPRTQLDAWVADPHRQILVTAFDTSDGVKSHASVLQSAPRMTKAADGKVWFTPVDGVSFVDPRRLLLNKLPPAVRVEQINADGKLRWQNWWGAAQSSLRLPPLSRDLEIHYTALSMVAPEKVRFKYKLEGYDRDWQEAGNRRQAFYTNLSPRRYRFRVTASNNSGVWNEAGDSLEFSIAPAYYQSTWFRLSLVALFFVSLWGLDRLRLVQVARELSMRLEGRVDERTRIARELHDTLLQNFQGLLLRFQAVNNLLPSRPEEAAKALRGALDRGAEAITLARNAVEDLRSPMVEGSQLSSAIRALCEELRDHGPTGMPAVEIEVRGEKRELHPMLRDEVYRIAAEALRNAFRHAGARQMSTAIFYSRHELRLSVRDDGRGIDQEVLHRPGLPGHWGLSGMRERAELIGGDLGVWSGPSGGTEVTLSIPASIAYAALAARRSRWFRNPQRVVYEPGVDPNSCRR